MAKKYATIFVLNVANSMSRDFSTALDVLTDAIEDRVMSGKKMDMASVLLAGYPETKNELADEIPDQYLNVYTMCPIEAPRLELLRQLQNVSTSTADTPPSDILDAVIVAVEMIKSHCKKLKYTKRIIVLTDNSKEIDWLDFEAVVNMFKEADISLTIIGTDYELLNEPDCPDNVKINYKNWEALIAATEKGGEVMSLKQAYEYTQLESAPDVRPTPGFRGYLYLGEPNINEHFFGININLYLGTRAVPLPRAQKWSAISKGPTNAVHHETKYKLVSDPVGNSVMNEDEMIFDDKERLEEAYRFGKTAVLISKDEMEAHKLRTKAGMWIIGFIPSKTFPRHYLFSNVRVVMPGAYNTEESALALNAFATALAHKECMALVRFVARDNEAPKIGVLQPRIIPDEDDETKYHFILQFANVPFAEDTRDYKFKNADSMADTDIEGAELMDRLVDSMDLDEHLGPKFLAPEETFNAILWRVNKAIKTRALNPNAPLPDIKESHRYQFEVHPKLEKNASLCAADVASHCNVRKVPEKSKKRNRSAVENEEAVEKVGEADINKILHSAKYSSMGDSQDLGSVVSSSSSNFMLNRGHPVVESVGMITPVEDFIAMLNTPSDTDMVELAMQQMSAVILRLLKISFGNQHYATAILCLKAFRKSAAQEDAAMVYNDHLREIKKWCNPSNTSSARYEFWKLLKEEKLGLITNEECEDTDNAGTTKAVAEKFWSSNEDEEDIPAPNVVGSDNDDDDENAFNVDDMEDML